MGCSAPPAAPSAPGLKFRGGGNGLPDTRAADIAADPNDNNRFYVTFTGASGGLFRSDDLGATWTNITGGLSAAISADTDAFDVAVHNDGATSVVSVVLNGIDGPESNSIFHSVNDGAFTALDVPDVFRDAYGKFGLTADKTNPDLIYVSGGYALIGSNPFKATTYRVDASQPSGSQLTHLYSGVSTETLTSMSATQTTMYVRSTSSFLEPTPFDVTVDSEQMTVTGMTMPSWYYKLTVERGAATTHVNHAPVHSGAAYGAPHVDINTLAMDFNGSLLMGDHGGIFLLPEPDSASSTTTNTWLSKNGNLGVTEMHDIAYDHVSGTLIGANQDNCVVFQSAPGSLTWPVGPGFGGDGGDVAVADIGGGQSVRYASNQHLSGFSRLVYDAANNLVSDTTLSTSVVTDKQFTTPIAVNAVDPNRLLIGGSDNLYESFDRGDTINKVATVGANYIPNSTLVYGGRQNGVANPDVLYVAKGSTVYRRTEAGGAVMATSALPSSNTVYGIAINPEDWTNVFAVSAFMVAVSTDAGDTWSNITGNLRDVSSDYFTAVEIVQGPSPYLVVGTRSGVFASKLSALGSWFELGTNLPDVPVFDFDYDAVDDVLAAATLGRGAWLLSDASEALVLPAEKPILALSGPTTANEGSTNYLYSFTVTDPGDSFTIQDLTIGAGGELVPGSLVTTATGGSFQVNYADGPAGVSVSLQVVDSTALSSNVETMAVAVDNVKPVVAILGAPTSGSPGTTVDLTGSVTDAPADTTAGFVYSWLVQKYVNNVFVGNFASGSAANFSYTPDVAGKYNVFFKATDKDGATGGWVAKSINAASPDLTEDAVSVTVSEGMAATNSGTYAHNGPAPLTVSASAVGTVEQTQTSTTGLNVLGYWQLGEDDPGAVDGGAGNNPTLGQDASGLNATLNLTLVGSPTYASLSAAISSLVYDSFSSAGALAGPTVDNVFTLSDARNITKILNWHQNSSYHSGQDPTTVDGTISILEYPSGTPRGAWPAVPVNGIFGWEVYPNIVLPPGSYQIVESQTGPSSWSYTTTGGAANWEANKGLSQVSAAPVTPTDSGSVLAMSFNGSTDAYTLGSPLTTATDNFGIEAWVQFNSVAGNQVIVYNGNTSANGFGLHINGGTYRGLYGGVIGIDTGVAATTGSWHHVTLVRDNGATKIYIDGALVYNNNVGGLNPATGAFAIGRSPQAASDFLSGSVDDARVFTFAPGAFDPQDLGINTSVAGTWSWSYGTDDGPAEDQDVTITATTGVSGDATSIPFALVVENVAPTAVLDNDGPVNEGSAGMVSFSEQADPSTADTTASFHYAYDFDNDGVFEVGDGSYAGSSADASATVPASFLTDGPGSHTVRGRIIDKDDGFNEYTTTITVDNIPPTAVSVSGPADALVGQVVNFAFAATDVPADQAAGFTYSIDWGDGSPLQTIDPIAGTGDAIVGHAYATANNYSIQVTATDKDDGVSGTPGSTSIQVNAADASSLQALIGTAPFVELAPADDADFQNLVTAINGLTAPASPMAITLILGAGPYSGVTLSPPDNIILDLAGNDTADSDGTQIASSSGPAVTVTAGEVFVQGDRLTTSADAPAALVTGGHLTLDQTEIEETGGFNNVAVMVTGGSANLGFDVLMKIHGVGAFVNTYARSALVPHPEGIDAELTPNTYQMDDGTIDDTINAVSLSSTSLASSPAPSSFGQAVTFSATVDVKAIEHGLATGTVSFYNDETLLGDGTLSIIGGQFVASFTTTALSVGEHTIMAIYNGDQAYVASATALMHEVIASTNDAPVAADDAYTTDVDTPLNVAAPGVLGNDTDADSDPLTAILVSGPGNGTLTLNADGSFSYTPNAGYTGPDSFTYKANDSLLDSNVATVTITVNAAPIAVCGGVDIFETAPGVFEAPGFAGTLIVGSNGSERLKGTNGPDLILGLGGNDRIRGRNGDDLLCGGGGYDILDGGNHSDLLDGGAGPDDLYGRRGDDTLIGGNGIDVLIGGSGVDTLDGGDHYDFLAGNNQNDLLIGGDRADLLDGGKGNDQIFGNDGWDALYGNKGDDALDGGAQIDYCNGGSGNDSSVNCETTVSASAAAETLFAQAETLFAQTEAIADEDEGETDVEAIRQLLQAHAEETEGSLNMEIFLPLITR